MKMYILIKEDVPIGLAMTAAAHASLKAWFRFNSCRAMELWVLGCFDKVICKVDNEEFERAKEHEDYVVLTESALDNQEVALAFCPREEWPKFFKFLRLYK